MSETQTPPTSPLAQYNADWLAEKYVALRDKQAEIRKAQVERNKPIVEMMNFIENEFMARLNAQGATSMKTAHGTAYKTTETSATVKSWADCLDFIRETDCWEMLEARVSKTVVLEQIKEWVEAASKLTDDEKNSIDGTILTQRAQQGVPGVLVTQDYKVNIRRS